MVEFHIKWPNLGSLCVLIVDGLLKSLLETVEKRKSRFYGYNLKRVRSSNVTRRFEMLRYLNFSPLLFRSAKKRLLENIHIRGLRETYNNFVMFHNPDLTPKVCSI